MKISLVHTQIYSEINVSYSQAFLEVCSTSNKLAPYTIKWFEHIRQLGTKEKSWDLDRCV